MTSQPPTPGDEAARVGDCVIYSAEHSAYWGPNQAGYYTVKFAAGLYTRAEAERIAKVSPDKLLRVEPAPTLEDLTRAYPDFVRSLAAPASNNAPPSPPIDWADRQAVFDEIQKIRNACDAEYKAAVVLDDVASALENLLSDMKLAEPLAAPPGGPPLDDERTLREMVWLRHGCKITALYGDDGEMSCGTCGIDFKRNPVEQIQSRLRELGHEKAVELRAAPPGGGTAEPGWQRSANVIAAREQLWKRIDPGDDTASKSAEADFLADLMDDVCNAVAALAASPLPAVATTEPVAYPLAQKWMEDALDALIERVQRFERNVSETTLIPLREKYERPVTEQRRDILLRFDNWLNAYKHLAAAAPEAPARDAVTVTIPLDDAREIQRQLSGCTRNTKEGRLCATLKTAIAAVSILPDPPQEG